MRRTAIRHGHDEFRASPHRGRGFGPVAVEGSEVWVSWDVAHGFGLADEPDSIERFPSDDDTRTIAVQRREALISELEGD